MKCIFFLSLIPYFIIKLIRYPYWKNTVHIIYIYVCVCGTLDYGNMMQKICVKTKDSVSKCSACWQPLSAKQIINGHVYIMLSQLCLYPLITRLRRLLEGQKHHAPNLMTLRAVSFCFLKTQYAILVNMTNKTKT